MARRWVVRLAALVLALAFLVGVLRFGASPTDALYVVFLLAVPSVLLAILGIPAELARRPQVLILIALGAVVCLGIAILPTLEAFGWTQAFLGWSALFVTLVFAHRSQSAQRMVVLLLVLAGTCEALTGLYQAAGPSRDLGAGAELAVGTLFNRNHFAGLLVMIIPLGLGLLHAALTRRNRQHGRGGEARAITWLVLLASALMGVAVLLSLSRGGTVVLCGVLGFQAVLLLLERRRSLHVGLPARVIVVLLVLVLGLGSAFGLRPLAERFARLDQGSSRLTLYSDTLRLIADRPLGVGLGMYEWFFLPYQSQAHKVRFEHAENDYLETAAELGIAGAAVIFGLVLWRLAGSIRAFFGSSRPWHRGLGLGTAGTIVAVLIHSLFDFNLRIPSNLMVFAAVLGLSWSLDLERRDQAQRLGSQE